MRCNLQYINEFDLFALDFVYRPPWAIETDRPLPLPIAFGVDGPARARTFCTSAKAVILDVVHPYPELLKEMKVEASVGPFRPV